jgi:hypothetical protein
MIIKSHNSISMLKWARHDRCRTGEGENPTHSHIADTNTPSEMFARCFIKCLHSRTCQDFIRGNFPIKLPRSFLYDHNVCEKTSTSN